jgi:hypothetical protein
MKSDFKVDYKLKWVYNQNYRVAYVVKTSLKSESEIEKEDINGYNKDDE